MKTVAFISCHVMSFFMQHHCYYYFSAGMSSSTNAKHHVVVALHYKSGHDERNKGECRCSYLIMLQATSMVHCTYELFLFVHRMHRLGDAELPSVLLPELPSVLLPELPSSLLLPLQYKNFPGGLVPRRLSFTSDQSSTSSRAFEAYGTTRR